MKTGKKLMWCSIACIPFVVGLDAPYWLYAWYVQIGFVLAMIGFDIRDIRREIKNG